MNKNTPLVYLEISRKNLIHNFKALKKLTKKGTKVAVAIKGNAYGHGQNIVAKILDLHVDYFFVNSVEELELLRKVSKKRTFVLGYVPKDDLTKALKLKPILSFFSILHLREINKVAGKLKIKQEVHLPIDACLGREGFLEHELVQVFKEIKKLPHIKLGGMYAHFANIEDTNNFTHAQKQIKKYDLALSMAKDFGFEIEGKNGLETHISATSGLLVYDHDKGVNTIVRLGVGTYGLWPSEHLKFLYTKKENKKSFTLKPVLSWKSKVAQIKTLEAGHTIGYGLTYMTHAPTKIAVVPQGYADGYPRSLSSKSFVLIKGTRCKVLGRVSMNMTVVDVTHLKNIKIEDDVVLLGKQGREEITAEELAELSDTINYEVTTRISALLPRFLN